MAEGSHAGTLPKVGLTVASPQQNEGQRSEPAISFPWCIGPNPAAAADEACASMGSAHDDIYSSHERQMLRLRASVASSKVEEWLQVVRDGREAFYNEHKSNRYQSRCAWCPPSMSTNKRDGLMQCLECSVVGCGPSSTSSDSSAHMMCHFIYYHYSAWISINRNMKSRFRISMPT